MFRLPPELKSLVDRLIDRGLTPYAVGGAVRDAVLGISTTDWDLEVFADSDSAEVLGVLAELGFNTLVGRQFGVFKGVFDGVAVDVSLPRTEVKTGSKHTQFEVQLNPRLSFEQAARRRDFTCNAMGVNLVSGQQVDPFGGQADLKATVLRHVGPAFSEDPLRVMRALQFSGRFGLAIAPETLLLCQSLSLGDVSAERLWDEWLKLLLKSPTPSAGLRFFFDLGLDRAFPEFSGLEAVLQDPRYHPEGSVWVHTLQVVDVMAHHRTGNPTTDAVLMFAALCHDCGKPETTTVSEGRIRSIGHEQVGAQKARTFLSKLTRQNDLVDAVCTLVKEHMVPGQLFGANQTKPVRDEVIRRLAGRIPIALLATLARADGLGRVPVGSLLDPHAPHPPSEWLLQRATALEVHEGPARPLLKGQDFMDVGVPSGPGLGAKLKVAYEAQLQGAFSTRTEALDWLRKQNV
ncbi:MAG: CCA tRNA nucleotidyltransferase [Candidatus Margulisiibacteriota bacterium]